MEQIRKILNGMTEDFRKQINTIEYNRRKGKCDIAESEFEKLLTVEQKNFFVKYQDSFYDMMVEANDEYYIMGFKRAVKLILEAVSEE